MIAAVVLGLLVVAWPSLAKQSFADHKEHEQCDYWADHDGECVNNPRFMWSACLGSCLQHAQDVDKQCDQWMREGECENNPRYIQVHCPRSCNFAAAWNPWVRRDLEIDALREADFIEDESIATDVISAAKVMQRRLVTIFNDFNPNVEGITFSAPSHFLGMLGLAEGFLYVFRLHEVVLALHGTEEQRQKLADHIDQAERTIETSHFRADLLSRELPFWISFMRESTEMIDALQGQSGLQVSFTEVAKYFNGFVPKTSTADTATAPLPASKSLLNGLEMPLLGLGTWQLEGDTCKQAVLDALRVGFRSIDTAQAYQNEETVGQAIQDAIAQGIIPDRRSVFLATKVSFDQDFGFDQVKKLVARQLVSLQTDYIDLYMLHSPPQDTAVEKATWKALTELYWEGKLKSLGVSNYESNELLRLWKVSEEIAAELSAQRNQPLKPVYPAVVQNKMDVYHVGKQLDTRGDEVFALCRSKGILLVGYSAFSAYPFALQATHDPIVKSLSKQLFGGRFTPAQLLLFWALRHETAVLPRSHSLKNLQENMDVLSKVKDLSGETVVKDEETLMAVLDTLQKLIASPVAKPISLL